ncbi:MAG: penicillin-binding protein 2, partial [Candidatus Aminicenantes bacterium]|nr:penicillin-binding protein 2 [Candidatus Aminicenantes bacterium]
MINREVREKIKKRTIFTCIVFVLWVTVLVLRLVQLQIIDHARLKARVTAQNEDIIPLRPTRASIYDRHGTLLARSLPVYSVFYSAFPDEAWETQWQRIRPLLDQLKISTAKKERIKKRIQQGKSFTWLKRKIDREEAERIKALNIKGVFLKRETKRFYPLGQLAAQVLGKVDIDEKGLMGIEYKYNSLLAGKPGQSIILKDAHGRKYQEEILHRPVPGQNIYLTLDTTIQYIAERELARTVHEFQANWGTAIVSCPLSGEILAMANFPSADPNSSAPEALRLIQWNSAIQQILSPGSTFKIITYAAALENQAVQENEEFDCHLGYIQIAGTSKRIRDH